jgi:hypothetical protein
MLISSRKIEVDILMSAKVDSRAKNIMLEK